MAAGTLSHSGALVGRSGSSCGRRVLLRCRAGPRRQGRCSSRAQCSSWRCSSSPGSTHSSEAELAKARADANAARAQKQCGPVCRTKLAAEAAAKADVEAARRELLSAESKATTDSPLQAPTWLLPAALDLVALWRSGRASQGTVQGRFASLFRSTVVRLRSATQSEQMRRHKPKLCPGAQPTTTPMSFLPTQPR